DVEVRFNDSDAAQYNLFNVRWVILPVDRQPAVPAVPVSTQGRWRLWQVRTTGYLQVVDTAPAIAADRTNLGQRTAAFLTSRLPARGLIPVIAFAGASASTPTNPSSAVGPGPARPLTVQFARR